MDIEFALNKDGLLVVVLPPQRKIDDNYDIISLNDYYQYKNELETGIVNDKIKINILAKENLSLFSSSLHDCVDTILNINNSRSFTKEALDLVNHFLDKEKSYMEHDFPNKNKLCLYLNVGSYFIDNKTIPVKHIELSMGEYYQGDYGGTTSEGCHYMAYDVVYMKATDSLNAVKLFQVSKLVGPTVSFKTINELFFNNKLKFYSIKELANM